MDVTPTSILPPKSPDPEPETPTRIHHQPTKSIPFSNGFLKRHPHTIPIVITYKECLKNHAATIGGHAVDGCGEFMPSPTATHTDPTSLKCAACGCHRNFHRREPDDYSPNSPPAIEFQPHHRHHPPPPAGIRSPSSSSPPPISSSFIPSAPHMLLALSTGGDVGNAPGTSLSSPRKRFRTKFSQTQKEKMFRFAEKLGWKMQKRDEELIQEFCNEIKVEKAVFKVWMHNNKNSLGKRVLLESVTNGIGIVNPTTTTTTDATAVTNNVVISNVRSDNDNGNDNNCNDEQKQFVVAANAGSSSSS